MPKSNIPLMIAFPPARPAYDALGHSVLFDPNLLRLVFEYQSQQVRCVLLAKLIHSLFSTLAPAYTTTLEFPIPLFNLHV
jgi:hypothetical protein